MSIDPADRALPDFGFAQVSSPREVSLDVVFVHGLGGSRSLSWTNTTGEFWPAWLSQSVPNARIWTYGYNSGFWKSPSEDALELHNARLLEECLRNGIGKDDVKVVFICHSLGGILVKSSLVRAFSHSEGSNWAYLEDQVASIVFLGTPHRGSEWANRLYLLLLGPGVLWPGTQFVPLLRKGNSGLLATVAERFNNIWGSKPVLTFREQRGVVPLGRIVKPEDARTNCSGEVCVDVPYNHVRMAKIKSRDEVVFQTIVSHLKNVEMAAEPQITSPPAPDTNFQSPSTIETASSSITTLEDEDGEYKAWSRIKLKSFYQRLQDDVTNRERRWEILDETFDSHGNFQGGKFTFCYPGHESTIVILTTPSKIAYMEAEWTIISPNATYHPGRHDGRLSLPSDFPFRPPKVIWDSPIVSPYVNFVGKTCTPVEHDFWSPGESSFYAILHSLAAIVIFGPELAVTKDLAAPAMKPETLLGGVTALLRTDLNDASEEWMLRVTNLFSRAYNRLDDDDELDLFDGGVDGAPTSIEISDHTRQASVLAIEDVKKHFESLSHRGNSLESVLESRGMTDPKVAFQNVSTLRQLLQRERAWVDVLNEACGNIAAHGWGKAESFQDHRRRIKAMPSGSN